MSATVVERPLPSTWHLAVASFLPAERREVSARWIRRVPLGLVLLAQIWLTVRLDNTAYRDEGLYIWTGHRMFEHWFHGAVLYDSPSQYFSGSPSFYPPLAAVLDRVGGLTAVRGFSLLCMLGATTCIHLFTQRLFSRRAGLAAALVFALAGPTQLLGNFATFDALAVVLLAGACALGVWAAQTHRLVWAPAVGVLLTMAVAAKYASLLFVPFVVGVVFFSTPWRSTVHRFFAKHVAVISFLCFASVLAVLVRTIGRADYVGFRATTAGRDKSTIVDPASPWQVVEKALGFAGPWYLLVVVAAGVAMWRLRTYALPLLLAVATLLPVAYQARLGEAVSLEKHIDFGLVFGAPLIGILVTRVSQSWRKLAVIVGVAVLVISGVATSQHIFSGWSNTQALTDVLSYKFRAAPYIRLLGEPYEPVRYRFEDKTQYWQWDTTDPIDALYYKPAQGPALRGIAAAKAGLADDYWQVVYFDGSTGASQELEALLPSFGYTMTDTVPLTNNRGPDVYRIWQRFK